MNEIISNKDYLLMHAPTLIWLTCLFFPMAESVYISRNPCKMDNCSFQMPYKEFEVCENCNTSMCTKSFLKASQSSTMHLLPELNEEFSVSVIPFTAKCGAFAMSVPLSAINISFTLGNKGIESIAVKISGDGIDIRHPICRVLYFKDVLSSLNLPVHLFYDCFYNLVESNIHSVTMDFIALPMNRVLSYFVYIPGVKSEKCNWRPLIMIFREGLRNGIVRLKFSQAQMASNVSVYSVKLIQKPSNKLQFALQLHANSKSQMIHAEFESVPNGKYSVIVDTISAIKGSCNISEIAIFLVEHGLISRPKVLLLHSYNCHRHQEFVEAFVNYLNTQCYLQVSTIYGVASKPKEWIQDQYKQSDVIMFLISESLFYTLDSKHYRDLECHHHWRHALCYATKWISHEFYSSDDSKKKKICKVCFPYSGTKHIPDELIVGCGKCYNLPKEMDQLLSFIHDYRTRVPCTNIYPSLPGSNIQSSPGGKILTQKMQALLDQGEKLSLVPNTSPKEDVPDTPINVESESSLESDDSGSFNMKLLAPEVLKNAPRNDSFVIEDEGSSIPLVSIRSDCGSNPSPDESKSDFDGIKCPPAFERELSDSSDDFCEYLADEFLQKNS